jgi:hypothetical protein
MVGDHSRMAQIQQERCLLGGEAKKVLVVVVDDFHQVRKQHFTVVGQISHLWMGKADISTWRFVL